VYDGEEMRRDAREAVRRYMSDLDADVADRFIIQED